MEKQQLALLAIFIAFIAIYTAVKQYLKANEILKGVIRSRFNNMQNLDADQLRIEIASMSLEDKEAMLNDIIEYGHNSENNYRIAIVILQYMVEELKPNKRI